VDTDEFKYARYNMPVDREDTIFVYASTRFLQNLLTPQYQIELRRRNQVVTDIMMLEMAYELNINGKTTTVDVDADTPLLWVVRDTLKLTGTKFGCGVASCGACTMHIDGQAVRTCVLPVSAAVGKQINTIENLSDDNSHPVQQAWLEQEVPQCGYCQSGMIMAATALLENNPNPTEAEIDSAMTNICRCGTYNRVRKGIHQAVELMAAK